MSVVKTKVITAKVDTEVADWLERARKHGETKTYHINEAMRAYIKSKKTVVK